MSYKVFFFIHMPLLLRFVTCFVRGSIAYFSLTHSLFLPSMHFTCVCVCCAATLHDLIVLLGQVFRLFFNDHAECRKVHCKNTRIKYFTRETYDREFWNQITMHIAHQTQMPCNSIHIHTHTPKPSHSTAWHIKYQCRFAYIVSGHNTNLGQHLQINVEEIFRV